MAVGTGIRGPLTPWAHTVRSAPIEDQAPTGAPDVSSITAGVARGDREALATFYAQWFDPMYAMARHATGRDEAFCLDVVQESFVKVIRSLGRIEHPEVLRAWLRRVVTRTAYDMLREERRRLERERASTRSEAVEPDNAPGPSRIEWLEEEIARMDAHDGRLILARHRFGWTLRKVGASLGIGTGAADGRLGRIVARLRERAGEIDHD